MHPDFWHERWQTGQIGFHLPHVNPSLITHGHHLRAGPRVLVPLCGKSLDLEALAAAGHLVDGVELSALAIDAFWREAQRPPTVSYLPDGGRVTQHERIRLFERDVLTHIDGPYDACWDRGATVALPPNLRRAWVRHHAGLMRPGAVTLLVSLHREPTDSEGPPFCVPPDEVEALYGATHHVERLSSALADPARSDVPMIETVWRLIRNEHPAPESPC
jgi:thiopurine S-methyltransferase